MAGVSGEGHVVICDNMEVAGTKIVHYHFDKEQQATFPKEPIWFDVRDSVKSFTGRNDELKHLHDALQSKGGQAVDKQITSISGLGGIGKSELARKYAYDYKKYYGDNVVWINAETQESLRESFLMLAKNLRIPTTEEREGKERDRDIKSNVKDVYKYFANVASLFIFDNAENYKDISEFLPSSFSLFPDHKEPYVLITSRNQDWEVGEEGKIELIKLNEFTPQEAIDFIKKSLNIENDLQNEHIENLARELQYFPLALRQAVTYIKETNKKSERRGHKKFEISDYLKKYKKDAQELLEFSHKSDRYAKTTFLTWKITLENIMKIGNNGKEALEILEIMAYLSPDNIPIKGFFSKIPIKSFFSKLTFGERIIGEERSWSAVELLSDYSMINIEKGVSNIHRLVQQVIRIDSNNLSKEEKILENALKLINSADIDENSPSHITSVWNYASKYGKLIDEFYLNSFYGWTEETPLHLLAQNGYSKAIEAILTHIGKNGLNEMRKIIYTPEKSISGFTPFQTAINNGYLDVMKVFVEKGADVKAADNDGNTPLHWAAINGNLDAVKYLVEKGADVKAANNNGWTPLHLAAEKGHWDVVKYLVEKGADVKAANNDGNTPLHRAAINGNLDAVKYLVKKGAEVKAATNDGWTPLHLAAEKGHWDVVKYLVEEKGADVKAAHNDGWTPLHLAAEKGHWDVVKYLVEGKGADVKAANNGGYTPLHWAAGQGNLDAVKYLVEKGADVLARNSHDTVLHRAVRGNNKEIIRLLLERIKEKFNQDSQQVYQYINAQDTEGDTPLMWAAEIGRVSAAQVLLEYNVDINLKNNDGMTALHWAANNCHLDIAKLLLKHNANANIKD